MVPARVGGVDLSKKTIDETGETWVPARVGGVDLSNVFRNGISWGTGPRPCGRGGFKHIIVGRPRRS